MPVTERSPRRSGNALAAILRVMELPRPCCAMIQKVVGALIIEWMPVGPHYYYPVDASGG